MSGALPSGTITFLFTDIEGSTRLLQALGDRYPPVLRRHNEILRQAIGDHDGIVVNVEGDAFFAVFPAASAAVSATVSAQHALAAEPWPEREGVRVRMGLHTGEAAVQGDSYVGLDVHRAARIAGAAHGGQVLLSSSTRALVQHALPDGVEIRDLGEHRLKDLLRPEGLADLEIEGLPSHFPPPASLNTVHNNLPTQLTSFIGREEELAAASRLLADARLLTLSGPGGTGKTRLALQLAADAADRFPDGVYWVPLSSVSEPALVAPAIAQAMNLPDPGGRAFERIVEQLEAQRVLLVLDNFEQVVSAGRMLADLLVQAPGVTALVTSRALLKVYGEREYPVPPLQLPDGASSGQLATLSQYAAVALFIERAVAVRPTFAVTNENAPAVAEICIRLDGLPLAIELAAARVRLLSPQAILERLGDQLALLSGGARDRPERQQTLRGAIKWSYDLLEPDERRLFARVSVFGGGVTPSTARELLGDGDTADGDEMALLDRLASLADKSLLTQGGEEDAEPRFGMLHAIREFAAEQLEASGDAAALRAAHARYFLALAEGAASEVMGQGQRTALDRMEAEHDNLRTALSWALAAGEASIAMRLFAACWRFWQMRGYLAEARDRADHVLALPPAGANPSERERVLDAAGGIHYWMADMDGARRYYEEALAIARDRHDERAEAEQLYNLLFTWAVTKVDLTSASEIGREALELFRRLGDEAGTAKGLWGMLNVYYFGRDWSSAMEYADQAVAAFEKLDDRFMLAWSYHMKGLVQQLSGDLEGMHDSLARALGYFREANDLSGFALSFDAWATYWYARGDRDRAMRLSGAADALQSATRTGLGQLNREFVDFRPEELAEDPALSRAFTDGQHMDLDSAIELATAPARDPA